MEQKVFFIELKVRFSLSLKLSHQIKMKKPNFPKGNCEWQNIKKNFNPYAIILTGPLSIIRMVLMTGTIGA